MDRLTEFLLGLVMGGVQGLAEFFPVSSSGHLVILQKAFNMNGEPVPFVVAVHAASVLAVLWAMRREIASILKSDWRTAGLLVLATVPAGLAGLLLKKRFEAMFDSLAVVGFALLVTGSVLCLIEVIPRGTRAVSQLGPIGALVIGLAQAIAIIPGLSRSGMTISAGLATGLSRDQAVRFSFLLSILVIGGASGVEVLKGGGAWAGISWPLLIGGMIASFIYSLVALYGLLKLVQRHRLSWFALWCVPMGAIVLIAHYV